MKKVETVRARIRRVILILSAALLFGVGYLVFWHFTGIGFFCPVKRFLSLDCPGCGITRALFALLTFDFVGMLKANLLSPLIIFYFLYVVGYAAIGYIRTGKYEVMPKPFFLNIVFLILFLLYGILRNTGLFTVLF